ncbi:MAG: hypothetical protein CHACPFDD_01358 [Phycisphaerae bacterium]|nr:hypothetical protein [Phycisphaerae bacterium]
MNQTDAKGRVPAARVASRRASDLFALLATLAGLGLSIRMAWASDGVYHDDDLTHLQMARWAWQYPEYLLNDWGRPGFTLLYALPAQPGWLAARAFSGLLTALTAWLVYGVARGMGIRAACAAPALFWVAPMTFSLSYTTLTETALAFYLSAAMYLHLHGRPRWAAVLASLFCVTRQEALILLPIWALATWTRNSTRRGRWTIPVTWWLLLWAPVAHNLLNLLFVGSAPLANLLDAKPTAFYGHGTMLTMLERWLAAASPGLIALAAAGAPLTFRRRGGALWIGCGLAYLLTHVLIYRFGLFSSGGYARFLVPLAPILAVAAADALSAFLEPIRARWARARTGVGEAVARVADEFTPHNVSAIRGMLFRIAAAIAVLWVAAESERSPWLWWGTRTPLLLVVGASLVLAWLRLSRGRALALLACPALLILSSFGQTLAQSTPHVLQEDQLMVREATDWLRANGLSARPILSANAWVYQFLDLSQPPARLKTLQRLDRLPPGGLFIWDVRYCNQPPHDIPLTLIQGRNEFAEIWHGGRHTRDGIYCRVFERR